jgi:hypothetical protein
LRVLATILLFTSIFLQTFTSFVIQAEYLLNKSYIANNLCVNKDKPAMHCNGKCYLSKKLKEQEKQDQQAPTSKKERLEVVPFFLPKQFSFAVVSISTRQEYYVTDDPVSSAFLCSIFHPPAF